MRVKAVQVCPELIITSCTPWRTAACRSASAVISSGDLPPSSRHTRFTVGAAAWATRTPAPVEPVNDTMSTCGCRASASPTLAPGPLTRLNTPAGRPMASIISASRNACSGVSWLGLTTTVQPAARAGASLPIIWCSG
ncbi:hypothetical protein D3C75_917920 [compost metagenome]